MARIKPEDSDAVKIEKIRSGTEQLRILERNKTWRVLGCGALVTIMFGIVAVGIVRMTEKPAWLTFSLAILALIASPTFLLSRLASRIRRDRQAFSHTQSQPESDRDREEL